MKLRSFNVTAGQVPVSKTDAAVCASVGSTNGTSISESLYCVWVYVKIDGHCVKIRTGEQEVINPNSLCFIPNVMSHISAWFPAF